VRKIKFSFHPVTLEAKIEEENADIQGFSEELITLR
jgi:hypothetical protein